MSRVEDFGRIVLGVVFMAASVMKILEPGLFAQVVQNYQILPPEAINPVSMVLPWLEFVCGAALVCGVAVRGASVLITGMLTVFIIVMWYNVSRGLDISCGCFSVRPDAKGEMMYSVWRDTALLVLSILVMWRSFVEHAAEVRSHRLQRDIRRAQRRGRTLATMDAPSAAPTGAVAGMPRVEAETGQASDPWAELDSAAQDAGKGEAADGGAFPAGYTPLGESASTAPRFGDAERAVDADGVVGAGDAADAQPKAESAPEPIALGPEFAASEGEPDAELDAKPDSENEEPDAEKSAPRAPESAPAGQGDAASDDGGQSAQPESSQPGEDEPGKKGDAS
ncbi:hypothetical protein JCM16814_13120 [Desulfobaculum senezii]